MVESSKESSKESSDHDLFVTEFPKKGFGIVDYLQGRMHFALMDQMKLMSKSGMKQEQIKESIIKTITEIVDNFEPKKESESS
jgi:predicted nucleotidyltransferase